jgi:hypothetical protein
MYVCVCVCVYIVVVFQGLVLLACSGFRIFFPKLTNLFRQLVGLLGRGIGPTQGLYLDRTTQHRETRTHIHASSGIRKHDPSVRAAEGSTYLRPRGHICVCVCFLYNGRQLTNLRNEVIGFLVCASVLLTLKTLLYDVPCAAGYLGNTVLLNRTLICIEMRAFPNPPQQDCHMNYSKKRVKISVSPSVVVLLQLLDAHN